MTIIPNLFIVGAPKCGTTAMWTYLAAHPEIYMSPRKEPTFFAFDLDRGKRGDGRFFTRDESRYSALFAAWNGEKWLGEGSVWYLYSRVAAREIKRASPDARIIVMLRNPVEMMYSLHAHWVANGGEDIGAFEDALAVERERTQGRRLPRHAFIAGGLLYRQVASYANQVRRYIEVFGREQMHVILYEEFAADASAAYRQVCEFLEIDTSVAPSFERLNENAVVRSPLVRNMLRYHPRLPGGKAPEALGKRWRQLKRALLAANRRTVRRQPLDPHLRDRLAREMMPDVENLGRLLGRDLVAYWALQPTEDEAMGGAPDAVSESIKLGGRRDPRPGTRGGTR